MICAELPSGRVVPAAFALLPGKGKPVYKRMWSELHHHVDGAIPEDLMMDMEPAVASAFLEVFGPAIRIIYCYFHVRKALRENLQKKGCKEEASTNPNFNKIYRITAAVASVPAADLGNVVTDVLGPFMALVDGELSENAVEWCDYFVATFIGFTNPTTGR